MRFTKTGGVLAAAVVVAAGLFGPLGVRADPGTELSADQMISRVADPAASAEPLPAGARMLRMSSHDRTGGNYDGGSYDPVGGAIAPNTFIAKEGTGLLLADVRQPGCLVRLWMTGLSPATGGAAAFGNIRMFVDNETTPRIDAPAVKFFAGKVAGFPTPLVGDYTSSSGGNYDEVPLCFSHYFRLETSATPASGSGWYQADVLTLPAAGRVTTGLPSAPATSAAMARLGAVGTPPPGPPTTSQSAHLQANTTMAFATIDGPGALQWVRIHVAPFDLPTLRGLRLQLAADDGGPQVDVPLADAFGDGLEVRRVRSLAFGEDPATQSGYVALVAPHHTRMAVSIASKVSADVTVATYDGPPIPGAGVLHGAHHDEVPKLGSDITLLDAPGAGHVAAIVLDLVGQEGSVGAAESFMEGDDRAYVDGSRSPSEYGTGTEDAFNGGFYYGAGAFSLPTHGAGPLGSAPNERGTQSQYRVFGSDGVRWERGVHIGIEHGGGDETYDEHASVTTWWYQQPSSLVPVDAVNPGDPASLAAHHLSGPCTKTSLSAYFEGEHDGNEPASTYVVGGEVYPAPPPSQSPEGVTAAGLACTGPVSLDVIVPPNTSTVVLRRLFDANGPAASDLAVAVNGLPLTRWWDPIVNPSKRWREDDVEVSVPRSASPGVAHLTLIPGKAAETIYGLQVFARA